MSGTALWTESSEKLIAAHWQPALLIDLLVARDISSHRVLRGTGIFYDDLGAGEQRLSADQLLQLIKNAQQLEQDHDLSFRWGASALPGHCGCYSQLLASAENLQQFIDILGQYRRVFSPLLTPRIYQDADNLYLHWIPATGLAEHHTFLIEMTMTAVVAASRWLHDERLPWRFAFSHEQPTYVEQYQLNLGDHLQFGAGIDVMMIDKCWLNKPFLRRASQMTMTLTARRVLQRECEQHWNDSLAAPFMAEAVYRWLMARIQRSPGLEVAAEAFFMSPATFKRKLKKHNTSFQQLQDQARLHTSLYLFHVNGWSNERVAQFLNFNDTTNFRRAFKRWSGLTPSASKLRFCF